MLNDRSFPRRRIVGLGASGLAAAAVLAGAGYTVVSGPPELPRAQEARSAGQNVPPASTAPGQPASPDDRRRWLYARRTPSRYRSLRKSTGTHKQNRRRVLAGR